MKKVVLIIVGMFIVGALVTFNNYTKNYFSRNDIIMQHLELLKQKELQLNYEILSISVYLYKNFDGVVELERGIRSILTNLQNDPTFQLDTKAYAMFLRYKKDILSKIDDIYRLETIIAPLKNADMYIAELTTKLPELKTLPISEKRILVKVATQFLLAKSSQEEVFISNLSYYDKIKYIKQTPFTRVFLKNVQLFKQLLPKYINDIRAVLEYKTQDELENCITEFIKETKQQLKVVTIVSVLLILFVILSIVVILILFVKIEKENKLLETTIITDDLTKLYNRRKLVEDVKAPNQTFLIVDIDDFKVYNDIYGIDAGDFILKEITKVLQHFIPTEYKPKFYRIGADAFGILLNNVSQKVAIELANEIVNYFRFNPIKYQDVEFNVMISIGISDTPPLIETADIILKTIKQDKTKNVGVYDPSLNQEEIIKENIKKASILKQAIDTGNIIPYFQPIFSNKTGEIIKYEVLARIKHNDEVLSIYPFLELAKKNRLYKFITMMIYERAIDLLKQHKVKISLNVSIDDIENKETMSFINGLLHQYPELFEYITFEILEDDAISNYDELKNFIHLVKSKGSEVAIDDFGSGYSNFEHILNLDIDYLKIDGSLIKNINHDKKSELIVETIIVFANKTGIKTIAEFVHSKEVLQKVKELGIDYSQGFYLGEPQPNIKG
ncbi:MAG: bifunctional diguanylate cyclase/phosphodiesterase [Epsilonproteobacteria bacterium]|nr:bifunctional diguanylate cyclase/phosphodiesterase [Campylobacterota bacterium]